MSCINYYCSEWKVFGNWQIPMENSENNNQWKLESALSRFVILGKLLVIVTGLICGGRICAPFAGLFWISQTWLSFTLKLHKLGVTKIFFGFLQMNTPSFVRNRPSHLWPLDDQFWWPNVSLICQHMNGKWLQIPHCEGLPCQVWLNFSLFTSFS